MLWPIISHIWDMWHNDGRVAELTMEDQGQDQLFEGIGEVDNFSKMVASCTHSAHI